MPWPGTSLTTRSGVSRVVGFGFGFAEVGRPLSAAPLKAGSFSSAPPSTRQMRALRGSADALGQRDDDPFRPPDVGHPPGALVLADATDQSIALGSCPIDSRLQVVDLEGHVAQSQFVGHGGR